MSIFYNSLTDYSDASTDYNGTPTVYTYSGGITVALILNHNIFNGTHYAYNYDGRMVLDILLGSPYVRGFLRVPTISGLVVRVVPNSRMVIRQYYKFRDPVRIGGCTFCGTYLYND